MPKRNKVTTISIDKNLKLRLVDAVGEREQLNKDLTSWDDLISYLTYIIENQVDLR